MTPLLVLAALAAAQPPEQTAWVDDLAAGHELTPEQTAAVRAIVAQSDRLGQGLPGPTRHPMTPETCAQRRRDAGLTQQDATHRAICGRPWMAPLYDPASEQAADATTCIDVFEFPDLPCRYPVVWVRASEAAQLCEAMGKRMCDAHEWEGACQGALGPADYRFDLAAAKDASGAVNAMRTAHNKALSDSKRWSTGEDRPAPGVCAQASRKSEGCDGSNARVCGSNTYPTGAFPRCTSPLGVYDLHGNAAEHMNLPLAPEQQASNGRPLGVTEMKGSWFIFDHYKAHEDWCRWRAPYWHGGPVEDADSHRNYHLGFRCCADVEKQP